MDYRLWAAFNLKILSPRVKIQRQNGTAALMLPQIGYAAGRDVTTGPAPCGSKKYHHREPEFGVTCT